MQGTGFSPRCQLHSHSPVRSKRNSYFVEIEPRLKKELFEVCVVCKKIAWAWTEAEYCKISLWFTTDITCGFIFKHIIRCTYNISQKNWIDTFYYLLFTDGRTKSNHTTIGLWYSTYAYTYSFYILISIFIITFFDVSTKLNNHILQCSDLKYMYEIELLQINCDFQQSSNVFLSNYDRFLNRICITITFYDKCMKSNNHILRWCNLKMCVRNQDITYILKIKSKTPLSRINRNMSLYPFAWSMYIKLSMYMHKCVLIVFDKTSLTVVSVLTECVIRGDIAFQKTKFWNCKYNILMDKFSFPRTYQRV